MKKLKVMFSLVLVIAMMAVFAGCASDGGNTDVDSNNNQEEDNSNSNADTDTNDDVAEESEDELSGTVTISGSTSVEKIGTSAGAEFMALYPSVEVTYEGIGSSGGVANANDRVTNIGTASRSLKDNEKEYGLVEKVIAYDGIAVITHPSNSVTELTPEQVQKIYLGEITNWSEVGGDDLEIVVVSREDGSGTRGAFEEIVGFEDALTSDAILAEGNGNVQTTVAGNEQAIGYVSFTYINDTVQPVLINGVEPSVEDVLNGSYPISRPFIMMYHEDNMNDAANAFIEFMMSPEGQDIVEEEGGIRID